MTTDRGRWLPLVKCDARNFSNPCEFDRGSRAQRDADWEVVEPVIALATTMAKALVLFENDGLAPEHTYCLACGHFAEPSGQIEHDADCPVGQFLALKAKVETKA